MSMTLENSCKSPRLEEKVRTKASSIIGASVICQGKVPHLPPVDHWKSFAKDSIQPQGCSPITGSPRRSVCVPCIVQRIDSLLNGTCSFCPAFYLSMISRAIYTLCDFFHYLYLYIYRVLASDSILPPTCTKTSPFSNQCRLPALLAVFSIDECRLSQRKKGLVHGSE